MSRWTSMTKSPFVVSNFAWNTSGAFSAAFDGSRSAGWATDARGPPLAAGAVDAVAALVVEPVGSGSVFEHAGRRRTPAKPAAGTVRTAFMGAFHITCAGARR